MTLTPHPERPKLAARLLALGRSAETSCDGLLYRFINPTYSTASQIADGEGAIHASGRWNAKGLLRLSYTSLAPETALAEALAHVRYFRLPPAKALPRVLVSLRLKASRVLDLRDGSIRRRLVLAERSIRTLDWRAENQRGNEAITQAWGVSFHDAGLEALIVPSAAEAGGSNVLVFPENLLHGSRFEVDSEVKWPGS